MHFPHRLLCAAGALFLWPTPLAAMDLFGDVGLISDYRYRGVSLSNGKPVIQASVTLEHESGLYSSLWGSTLDGIADLSNSEIDLTAGYGKALSENLTIDLSGTFYAYPSAAADNYFEATAMATATHGNASGSFGLSYIPGQRATRDDDGLAHRNAYAFVEGAYDISKTPVTLNAHFGYERGWFDEVERGGKWDWALGAEIDLAPARLGLTYLGSNADAADKDALVASLFLNW